MIDQELLSLALESNEEDINELLQECSNVLTDTMTGITQALEMCETACLVGSYETVTESAGTEHLSVVYEASVKDFYNKVVELLKKAVDKIKEIGRKIVEKIKHTFGLIQQKIGGEGNLEKTENSGKNGRKYPEKVWKNGFIIDIGSGVDNMQLFSDGLSSFADEFGIKFKEFAKICAGDNAIEKGAEWIEKNQKWVSMKRPYKEINEYMKCKVKFNEEGNIKDWVERIFGFEQKGEDWIPSDEELDKLVLEATTSNISNEILNTIQLTIQLICKRMNDTCHEVERIGKLAKDPGMAPKIQQMANALVIYSEFGISVNSQCTAFITSKYAELVNYLVGAGICTRKSK